LGYAFYPEYSNVAYIVVVAAAPLLGTLVLNGRREFESMVTLGR